ncbi:inositol monophosphatase family protein [Aurantimonas sp. Leaf443]|uniref:inositol monophosphatase family protein n=1 Tax=Aurantimonas sp. Leaf443 TaxID=1736378 RepID=UPI00070081FF|nr:inositol monophosphatase family protein [Aurantimonas sp. Leaf443]KQT86250.1 inositol monophosphatase [Aurantimonas sp. Leaf443]
MSRTVDIERLADILREAALAEIMPRFRNLAEGDIRQKTSATDLVTEGDEMAERHIKARCREIWPEALFVGEESVAADPALLERLKGADLAIVVDPIDGTANFAAGVPLFAVMAAVVEKGRTVGGIIYDPLGEDWMIAEKDAGAWQRGVLGPLKRLEVAQEIPLSETIACGSTTFLPPAERRAMQMQLASVKIVGNYRNAGHEYRLLASGGAHFCFYSKLMPWDHLPGALIVEEAGGAVSLADGSPYHGAGTHEGFLIAACGRQTLQAARDLLVPRV